MGIIWNIDQSFLPASRYATYSGPSYAESNSYIIKLHGHSSNSQASKKPLCSEVYDEIVFLKSDEHIEKMLENKQKIESHSMIPEADMSNEDN